MATQLHKRIRSFGYAGKGIAAFVKSEPNAWIHAVATVLVIAFGLYFQLTKIEWCLIIFSIFSVWSAEAFNTAIEHLADTISTEHHPLIGKAKDIAAGAVLLSAIGALLIGIMIIGPYLLTMFLG